MKLTQRMVGFFSTLILIFLDQLAKFLALTELKGKEPIQIIKGVFELQYLENRGAAFGILQGKKVFFIIITVVILVAVVFIYFHLPVSKHYNWMRITLVLLTAGAIGNFIDRIIRNYVIDFFYFKLINFPIFNVADVYVSVAAVLLVILILFYYKDDELKEVFHR